MRWLFVSVTLVVLFGAFFWQQRDATKVSYVNGLPTYTNLPGQEFLFGQDCFILSREDTPAAYPLVACPEHVSGLPREVSDVHIGSVQGGYRILGTVKVGSRFKIISVRREESRRGQIISFEILFWDEADRPYPRLDTRLILDHAPEANGLPPVFLTGVVTPRTKF